VRTLKRIPVSRHGRWSTSLRPGRYSVKVAKSGFSSFSATLTVGGTSRNVGFNVAMSPSLRRGQIRIVLAWGAKPRDMDSYLKTPTGCVVSYRRKRCPGASLDQDDTNGWGPETTTINSLKRGTYKFMIKNYSGERGASLRGARVRIYRGGGLPPLDFVGGQAGRLSGRRNSEVWQVLTIDGRTGSVSVAR